jgi:hypothetical protein
MHEPRHEPSAKGRGRPWLLPLVAALGMLVLPTLAWFLFPQGDEPISVRTVGGAVVPAAPPAEQESAPLDVPTKGGRVIVGVVRDTDENNVEGASVYVERAPALRGATDESGRFRLRNAPTSGFVLVATKAGYVTGRATVSEGEPGSEVSVEVVLGGRGGVRGRVLGPDGKPTPGAFVTCTADGRTFQGRTNAEGSFELDPITEGCSAVAELPTFGTSRPVKLLVGVDNVLELLAPGVIEGVVLDERGAPVPSYLLGVESFTPAHESRGSPGGRTSSYESPAGTFQLGGLDSGRYVLTVSSEGRPPARSDAIEVEAGRTTSNVRIVLARGGRLTGVVTDDATGKPIAGATVALDSATWTGANAIKAVSTDGNGVYALEGVPPQGPFSVRISSPDFTTRILTGLDARGRATFDASVALRTRGDAGATTEFAGIGAVLANHEGGVRIAALVPGGPAEKAGLVQNDRILRIEGVSADELTISDCVQRLRGPVGTQVTVSVLREGGSAREVTLVREMISR